MTYVENLRPNPEIPFWKGLDAKVKKTSVIPAIDDQMVEVHIPFGGLPAFLMHHPELAHNVRAATRSICAQMGLEVDDQGTQLDAAIRKDPSIVINPDGVNLSVLVANHAARDIQIEEGTRLFRSFYDKGTEPLANGDLVRAMAEGEIEIDGQIGEDWQWAYQNGDKAKKNGVFIKIAPKRGWIQPLPSDSDSTPLSIPKEAGRDYRNEIDKLLVPVPETPGFKLWIGKTEPRVKLGNSVNAILYSMVVPNMEGRGALNAMGSHVNSHLIDGGSDWHLRVEVLSSTLRERMPDYAYFYFVRAS